MGKGGRGRRRERERGILLSLLPPTPTALNEETRAISDSFCPQTIPPASRAKYKVSDRRKTITYSPFPSESSNERCKLEALIAFRHLEMLHIGIITLRK